MKLFSNIVYFAILFLLFSSCRMTYHFPSRVPALYSLNPDLDSILVINRTAIKKGNGNNALAAVEGILTGEPILGDKYGSKAAINNFIKLTQQSDRLTLVGDGVIEVKNPTPFSNSTFLNKHFIDSICTEYDADGVISLEFFDSDSYYSSTNAYVRTLWKVYEPGKNGPVIEDEVQSSGSSYYYYSIIPSGYTSIANAGAQGAFFFMNDIVPPFVTENRYLFRGGSNEIKLGRKAFLQGDIEQAIYFWEVEAESYTSEKAGGRAAYNLALAYEVKGDYNKALEWIDASIARGIKQASAYKGVLLKKQEELKIVEEQMKRK